MTVHAIRGAIQLERDEREHLLSSTRELIEAIMTANELDSSQMISVLFTATPDITSEFPALAARTLSLGDVPLMCAVEMNVQHAMPRVVRVMMHVDVDKVRSEIKHIYLRGAVKLRLDIAQ